jgi:type I restriction enzyme, S subunit
MTADILFENFEMLAEAPNGIPKLRELILLLAVQGKLVPQDPNDESAFLLIKKIHHGKNRLIAEKEIKKSDPFSIITPEEYPYELPKGWMWCWLGDIANHIQDGTHFSPKEQFAAGGQDRYLYITSKNIKNDGVRIDNATFVSEKTHEEIYSRCCPEFGDLLLIKDGAITGRVTINNLREPFSLLSSVALIKTDKINIENRYVMSYLRSPIGREMILGRMSGSAIPRIILEKIRNTKVALPPFKEQHRIVAELVNTDETKIFYS